MKKLCIVCEKSKSGTLFISQYHICESCIERATIDNFDLKPYIENAETLIVEVRKQRSKDWHSAWRAEHPDKIKEYGNKYVKENPEKVKAVQQNRQEQIKSTKTELVSLKAILEKYGMICNICDKPIEQKEQLVYDHVIPIARGGTHTEDNIKPAHKSCNAWKGDRLPNEIKDLTPPLPGVIDTYYLEKLSAIKSVNTTKLWADGAYDNRPPITEEHLARLHKGAEDARINKTPEELREWADNISKGKIAKGGQGNIENLKKATPETRAKGIAKSAEMRRGTHETEEHRANIGAGLKQAYAEGKRTPLTSEQYLKGKWSMEYDCCVECGTTEVKHKGNGLCTRCKDRKRKRVRKIV
jgi:5-methylcytosine-specific restriction endonuclease McrA